MGWRVSTIVKPKCHGPRLEGLEPGRALAGCWRCRTATWRPQSGPIARRPPALPEGRVWAIVGSACSSPHTVASFPRTQKHNFCARVADECLDRVRCACPVQVEPVIVFWSRSAHSNHHLPLCSPTLAHEARERRVSEPSEPPTSTIRCLNPPRCAFWRRSERHASPEFHAVQDEAQPDIRLATRMRCAVVEAESSGLSHCSTPCLGLG